MIPSGVQVFVALDPVDMRWSFDKLAGAALDRIGYDARCGALFIYFGKRRTAVKVLFSMVQECAVSTNVSIVGYFACRKRAHPMHGTSSSMRVCSTRCSTVST